MYCGGHSWGECHHQLNQGDSTLQCLGCVRYMLAYCDPFALKSLLGHTTLAMTNQYVAAV